MNNFYVYGYVRAETSKNGPEGSYYYIGKGRGDRAYKEHTRCEAKVPEDQSRIRIISEGMSEIDAFQAEMLLIFLWGRLDLGTGILRNRTDGGEGITGHRFSEESKRKIGDKALGRRQSEETIQKRVSKVKGQKRSPEQCRRISEATTGVPHRKPTLEQRMNLSKALKGKKKHPGHGAKVSAGLKGKPKSAKHLLNLKKAKLASGPQTNSKTGYKGVTIRKSGKYRASYSSEYLGEFSRLEDAVAARKEREREILSEEVPVESA